MLYTKRRGTVTIATAPLFLYAYSVNSAQLSVNKQSSTVNK